MSGANLLVVMSDQHNPKAAGYAGHPVVKTPNLDALAAKGTRFSAAYTHSPLCVPARAAFATGRYVHETGNWDNASPYDGRVASWAHRLADRGHYVGSIGKLHYRSADDCNGFTESKHAMYVVEGQGDLLGCIRDQLPLRPHSREVVLNAGRGESSYTRYDDTITAATERWLHEVAPRMQQPWVLFCSLVCPHPPKMAPADYYDLYPLDDLPWPAEATAADGWTQHPAIADFRRAFRWEPSFSEAEIRNALAAYFGQISFLDHNIGKVLAALDDAGLADSTRVVYTTDHGDNNGNHGLWNKNTLYEDSAGVPLILKGPDIPAGRVIDEPVSHLDCFPTFMQALDEALTEADMDLPGTSLFELLNDSKRNRPMLLSQYHATGTTRGAFAVRLGACRTWPTLLRAAVPGPNPTALSSNGTTIVLERGQIWPQARPLSLRAAKPDRLLGDMKYIHHVGLPCQLFDLAIDPDEVDDLASEPAHAQTLARCEAALRAVCDPETIDAAAHEAQAQKVAAAGGRDALIARGGFNGSPVPGEAPRFAAIKT